MPLIFTFNPFLLPPPPEDTRPPAHIHASASNVQAFTRDCMGKAKHVLVHTHQYLFHPLHMRAFQQARIRQEETLLTYAGIIRIRCFRRLCLFMLNAPFLPCAGWGRCEYCRAVAAWARNGALPGAQTR